MDGHRCRRRRRRAHLRRRLYSYGYGRTAAPTEDSVIMLDVNPSVSISVDAEEKVLAVTPLNADGNIVVGDMDFTGSSLDVTVNASSAPCC